MNINSAVQTVVDLVQTDDRIRVRADLDASQGVPVDIILLDESTTFSENVDSSLLTGKDLILPDRRIRVRGDPDSGVGIGKDAVLHELAASSLVHIDAARVAVMHFAPDHNWIRRVLHLDTGYPIRVNVALFKVTLTVSETRRYDCFALR